jgi:hypothetical protein
LTRPAAAQRQRYAFPRRHHAPAWIAPAQQGLARAIVQARLADPRWRIEIQATAAQN